MHISSVVILPQSLQINFGSSDIFIFWASGSTFLAHVPRHGAKKYSPTNRKLMPAMIQLIVNLSETGQTVGTVQTTEHLTALKADIEFKENW